MRIEQLLLRERDNIIRQWINQVQQDELIESNCSLSYAETIDSLPAILEAIAHNINAPDSTETAQLLKEGIGHGKVRAEQDYDAAEIVREYAILRKILLETIFKEVNRASCRLDATDFFQLVAAANRAVDRVVAASMKRYTDERLRELNLLYDELINSNQELDRIVRNEQSNLAYLAHELKSPLSSITGYSELFLRRQAKEGATHPEYIEQVVASGRRLLKIIDSALEMSSYRAGKVVVAAQSIDACEVIAEVTTALRIVAQKKGLMLSAECDRDHIYIVTDKARLRQVITNLLSNAIRYTESGSILITTRLIEDKQIEIQVKDTGYGISAAEQGLIFEPYYQGEAGQQLQSSTGLGLAITNQIVRLLQGSIHLKSEPKKGSTFTISLPLQLETVATKDALLEHKLNSQTNSQPDSQTNGQSDSQMVAQAEYELGRKPSRDVESKLPSAKIARELDETQSLANRSPAPIPIDSRAASNKL